MTSASCRRTSVALFVLALAVAGQALSAAGPGSCCAGTTAGMRSADAAMPCQWITPTSCCDDTAATSSSPPAFGTAPLLVTWQAIALRPPAPLGRSTPAADVLAVPHAALSTIVLLL